MAKINPDDFDRESYLGMIASVIAENGYAVQVVSGEAFAYTIGRCASGQAELLMTVPISYENFAPILNHVAEWIETGNVDTTSREPQDGPLANGVKMKLLPADPEKAPINVHRAMYPDLVPDLIQVVFPDPAGRFPGEPGYDMTQPLYLKENR